MQKGSSRRDFLKMATGLGFGILGLAGCAAPSTPVPAPTASGAAAPAAASTVQGAPKAAAPSLKPTGTLTVNNNSGEAESLDAQVVDAAGWAIVRQIYHPLIQFDKDKATIVPAMAERWEASKDGLSYTFKLRKGIKWHKGYGEFTSDDVKFSVERCQDPATKSLWKSTADSVAAVQTPDPYTAVIVLKDPMTAFPQMLVNKMGWMVSKKALTEMGSAKHARSPIGTGPFMFDKWEAKSAITLVANPDYYEPGFPKVAKIVFKFVTEQAAALMAFQAGEYDELELDYESYKRIQAMSDKYNVYTIPTTAVMHMEINSKLPPLDKLEVRQALAYAIDYEGANKALGEWQRCQSHVTPDFPSYKEGFPPAYPYDPAKAKDLLAKAGFPNGFEIDLIGMDSSYHQITCTAVEASWRQAGIRAKVQMMPSGTLMAKRRAGEIQTWTDRWQRPPDEDMQWWDKFHSTMYAPNKDPFFGLDEMLEAGRKELDPAKRIDIYQKLDKFVSYDTVQSIPIGIQKIYHATQKWVSDFHDNGNEQGWSWEYVTLANH